MTVAFPASALDTTDTATLHVCPGILSSCHMTVQICAEVNNMRPSLSA